MAFHPQLRDWSEDDYASFLADIEADSEKWQQAYCLRLYFYFHSPMSRLLAARWDQLWEVAFQAQKDRRHLQWRYQKSHFAI